MNHLPYPAMRNPLRARLRLIAATVATAVLSFSGEASAQYVNVNSGGSAAQATGTDSIAVGSAATAAGSESTAIGTNARVYPTADTGSMAIGYGARVAPGGANASAGNLAIGMNAAVGGNTAGDVSNAIAIGTSAVSERSGGISIGASSHNAGAAIAIGNGANTGIDGQIAIGNRALADPSSIGANGGVAIGQDSYTSGVGSALGVNAHASGNSVAAGANSFAGWRDTVIGVQASATGNTSVAIGFQSNDGGRDQVVSVGANGFTRAVVNVTAGTTTTDAANVGQLPGTIAGNVVTMGNTLAPGASLAPATVTNVAAGKLLGASTDAVNGSQLFATNMTVTSNKQMLDNLAGRVVNGTIGLVQQQAGAPGSGAITVGAQTGGTSVDFTGTDGPRTLSGVAAGSATTDAVNVGQLNAVASAASDAVQYDNAGHTSVTLGGSGAAAPVALTNVAAGTLSASSVDAVNGGQLFATNQAVANTSTVVTNLSNGIAAGTIGLVQQAGGAPGNGPITVGGQTGGTSVDFTGTAGARTLSGIAAGTAATDAVNVGQLGAVANVAANAVQYDNAGHTSVTLGGAAAAAPVALTNVAAGMLSASSVDAVNGGQLFATNQAVANTSTVVTNLTNGIAAGTVGLVQQAGGAPGSGPITVGAQTGGTSVDFTGTAGARTLSGVAAGTAATDAINVGQLGAVANVAANAVQYDNAGHTSVTLGGAAAAAPVALTNVSAGTLSASSVDAVNGGQLFATNQAVANTSTVVTNLTNGIAAGTVGLVQQAGGAPGSGPITVGGQTGGTSVDFSGTDGARKLSGVAAGTAGTDAVNVSQLNAVAGVATNAVQYDNAGHTSVTLGGAGVAAPVALTNVAAGTLSASSTDAVNGAQLYATNQVLSGTTSTVNALSTGIAAGTIGLVQQAGGAPGTGTITIGAKTGGTAIDVSGTSGARQLKGVAAGTDATDAVNVSQLNATVSSATANAVVYDSAARSIVTLGGLGASVPVTLRNVAAGVLSGTSTDAVNGAQLYTTNLAVAANTGAIDALTNSLTDVQRSMARNTAQLQPIVSADALKYFAASSTGAPASASGTETVAAGGNALAAGANSVAIGTGAQAIGSGALALGANTSAKGSNSIALGQGSAASADNTVSIGNSATGLTRTLTNVSAGVAPTDAVNVRQLSDAVGGLRSQIEHDRADANGGSASAVAIASLPQAPAPGHSVVSIGGGTYAGQSAVAVGMSTYAGRWILKASGSTNTRGTVAAGAGAAYVW
ncbi:hemagglutinin [Burkholderia contaminans]|uniref:YadA-like family protein n=4 Tax=Burkholderia cepacia complex TaxID=87882 RepID=UPI0014545C02|nr:YadA-like family protein [Burkholderia contaminans]VWD45669.1 hemagglutinin [Burkholderia contaminans]